MKFDEIWAGPLAEFLAAYDYSAISAAGDRLAKRGGVESATAPREASIEAVVRGARRRAYGVRLVMDLEYGLETYCDCPKGYDCEHVYAVVLGVCWEAARRGSAGIEPARHWFPLAWEMGENAPDHGVFKGLAPLFDDSAAAGFSLQRDFVSLGAEGAPAPWWLRFLHAEDERVRHKILEQAVEERIDKGRYVWWTQDIVSALKRSQNPVDSLRRFEPTLEFFKRQFHFRLNPAEPGLDVFLKSEEAQTIEDHFDRQMAEKALLNWLAPAAPREGGLDRLELEWRLWRPAPELMHMLVFDTLLTTRRLRRSPRRPHQLEQLMRDISAGKRRFSQEDESLLAWILARTSPQVTSPMEETDGESVVDDPAEWLAVWESRKMPRWDSGAQARLNPVPARLSLASAEGAPAWHIAFPASAEAAESKVMLRDALVFSDGRGFQNNDPNRRLFVRDGDSVRFLDTGGMPFPVFISIRRSNELPLEALRREGRGAALASRVQVEDGLVREVSARPEAHLRFDGQKRFSIVALADGGEDGRFFLGASGNWQAFDPGAEHSAAAETLTGIEIEGTAVVEGLAAEQGSDTAPPVASAEDTAASIAGTIAVIPKSEDIAPLQQWIERHTPEEARFHERSDGAGSMEWDVQGAGILRLIEMWNDRPQGVTYRGDTSVHSLIARRPAPRAKVRVEASGVDWLKVSVEMEEEIRKLDWRQVEEALRTSQGDLILLPEGGVYRRDELEAFRRQWEALLELGLDPRGKGEQRLHAIQLAGSSGGALAELSEGDEMTAAMARQAMKLAREFKGVTPATIDDPPEHYLRPYQRYGADFLFWAAKSFGGALLADDMGLGKTVQMLAALTALRNENAERLPSLVVCPASVAHNWQREANRFAPQLKTLVIERGSERHALLERLGEYDLVIKNYALTRRDQETLRKQQWMAICVDEAQAIKNPGAEITRAVKSLNSRWRFALTGTPIENRLSDLWSIVDFVAPGYLGAHSAFEKRQKESEPQTAQRLLRSRLRPLLLRRIKTEVAPELPDRIEERLDCEMTEEQRKVYLAEVKKAREMLTPVKGRDMVPTERIQILAALTRLRQICCDPGLVGHEDTGSGKVDVLLGLLDDLMEAGHKTLVFSQFVRMLERLRKHLETKGIPYRMLTGKTRKRQELVDEFEADKRPGVFLISLKAGGTGLNLASASHVVLFDPWWNPAVEAQAIDRAHRIGQDKTVVAFRLVAEGGVEERILELQERKRGLARGVLEEEAFNRALTKEDFEYLLKI